MTASSTTPLPRRIQRLDEAVVNRIAAGEVGRRVNGVDADCTSTTHHVTRHGTYRLIPLQT